MAEYLGTTASSGAIIKKHKKEALEEYLSKWGFSGEGDVQAEIREGDKSLRGRHTLHIYGDDDFYPVKLDEDGEFPDEMESDCRGFIKGLAPFLETQHFTDHKAVVHDFLIVVQTCGATKCRYPLGAAEWILLPNGRLKVNGFDCWEGGDL
jgi:hypothetical protein